MKKIVCILLVLIMTLALASCGEAEEGTIFDSIKQDGAETEGTSSQSEGFLFEKNVDGTSVKFYGGAGKLDKVVAGDDATDVNAVSDDAEFGFFTKDMNFDGKTDFAFQKSKSGDSTTYFVFFAGNGKFSLAGEFTDPLFDAANKKIYSRPVKNGASYFDIYDVKDGAATLSSSTDVSTTPEFKSDLAAYEQYMAPADRDGYLILVNSEHTIDGTYVPENLTNLVDTRSDRAAQQMTLTAAKALEAMYIEMRAAGYNDVSVTSAYRSYQRQEEIFNMYLQMNLDNGYDRDTAYAMVLSDTALPGQSEHQTGLCCDMHNLGSASQAFANQPVYKWLCENCWKFGFILRYPADKEDVTKITFEPWHYRFVGRYHAAAINAAHLSFEEYSALINQ